MNQFPATASSQPNREHLAAVEVLRQHRIDCCAEGTCYTIPSSKIQNEVRVAGNAVRPLLRAEANCPQIHPDDSKAPWLEILAVCAFRTGSQPSVTLVLGASSASVFDQVVWISDRGDTTVPGAGATSEKARLVSQAAALVDLFEIKCRHWKKASKDTNERVLMNLDNLVTGLQRRVGFKPKAAKPKAAKSKEAKLEEAKLEEALERNSNLILVCAESNHSQVLTFAGSHGIALRTVPSLSDFMLRILPGWRTILGTGLLPGIDEFVHALQAAISAKRNVDFVQADLSSGPRDKPAEMVATAAEKITTFGWLPQQFSPEAVIRRKVAVGKFAKTTGGAMTDGDISVFALPRVIVPGGEDLRIGTPEERLESSWMKFQSSFPQDECFMFCSHGAYGKQNDDWDQEVQSRAELRHLLPLGLLHPSALAVLRCIFPALQINVIGYNAAASTTTRSAVLKRLLRLVTAAPGDPTALDRLINEVSRLSRPGHLRLPRESPHARCLELDALIQQASTSASPGGAWSEYVFPESWPRQLLERLLTAGRNQSCTRKVRFSWAIRLASMLLRVDHGKLRTMLHDNDGTPRKELNVARALHAMIRTAAAGDPDVLRSRGSRFGHLALRREIASMMRDAVNGRLASPPLLAEWIAKHVRITCVMPLDPLDLPVPANSFPQDMPVPPCSFHSHRAYANLFGPNAEGAPLVVNLAPLLELAFRALSAGGEKPIGWLANKISQTNELMAAMMVRTGHLEDFPYGDFLSQKTARNLRSMLAAFPSGILVRCILAEKSGRELLERWCEELSGRVVRHWQSIIKGHDKASAGYSSETGTLLRIFGDHEGIAVAAIDCCRRSMLAAGGAKGGNAPLTVNFFPDELSNCFRAPRLTNASNVRRYFDRREPDAGQSGENGPDDDS